MRLSGKPALSFSTWNKEFYRLLKAHSAQTHPCAWDFQAGELLRAPVEGEGECVDRKLSPRESLCEGLSLND